MESVQQVLQRILRLPGAVYCAVIDEFTGQVVTDVAATSPSTTEVVKWAAEVAGLLNTSRAHELNDIMITSQGSYHLVRRIAPAGRRPVLVVLVLDRGVSNLAVARRELAASGLPHVLAAVVPLPITPPESAAVQPLDTKPDHAIAAPHSAEVAERTDVKISASIPRLPRRSSSSHGARRWPPPPVPRQPEPSQPTVLSQRWANDVGTMRQLLVGLRSLL